MREQSFSMLYPTVGGHPVEAEGIAIEGIADIVFVV
jgi:hypothetical protein